MNRESCVGECHQSVYLFGIFNAHDDLLIVILQASGTLHTFSLELACSHTCIYFNFGFFLSGKSYSDLHYIIVLFLVPHICAFFCMCVHYTKKHLMCPSHKKREKIMLRFFENYHTLSLKHAYHMYSVHKK